MKTETVKLTTWTAKCNSCEQIRVYYSLWTALDGVFLGYTEKDEFALLDAYEDHVYEEVVNLVKVLSSKKYFDNRETKFVLGLSCDLSPQGLQYEFYAEPWLECRSCRKRGLSVITEPFQIEVTISYVKHIGWSRLNVSEKRQRIQNALGEYELIHQK